MVFDYLRDFCLRLGLKFISAIFSTTRVSRRFCSFLTVQKACGNFVCCFSERYTKKLICLQNRFRFSQRFGFFLALYLIFRGFLRELILTFKNLFVYDDARFTTYWCIYPLITVYGTVCFQFDPFVCRILLFAFHSIPRLGYVFLSVLYVLSHF